LLGNYWHSFLCASLNLLKQNGAITFLLPAAWDYCNYAELMRESLPKHFESVRIHRSRTPLFKGVQEGSVILSAHGYRREHKSFQRKEHFSLIDLVRSLKEPEPAVKTLECRGRTQSSPKSSFRKLGDLMDIPIGAVCGDAHFFLLTETERLKLKLPVSSCVPIVSRSAHLRTPFITQRIWKSLKSREERVWLFRPDHRHRHNKAVRRYLRLPRDAGGCDRSRYKIRARRTWYQTELPTRVDGFMSGMSPLGPWISLSSMADLSATNTLYVVRFKYARTMADRAAIALALTTSVVRHALLQVGRRYPDGLLKFEPGDLKDIRIPTTNRLKGISRRYRQVIRLLLSGDTPAAERLADEWFKKQDN